MPSGESLTAGALLWKKETKMRDKRFITIFKGVPEETNAPIHEAVVVGIYDTVERKWLRNRLHLGFALMRADFSYYGLTAYASRFKDLQNAEFERNREGEIIASERPVKLTGDQVEEIVKPTQPKPATASQIANLSKGGLTDANRYKKPKLATAEVLEAVGQHRLDGLSWSEVGKALGMNPATLKTAFQRQQKTEGQPLQKHPVSP